MQVRTFFRIMFNNIIRNNVFVRVISSIVNFCCEMDTLQDTKKNIFFQSIGGDRIDCK